MQQKKDNAFKLVMGDKKIFLRFVHHFLPQLRDVQLKDIHPEKTDFIDQDLGERRSDVLYRVRHHGKEFFVFILVEHQSQVDALMSYRMHQYVLRIFEKYVNDHKEASTKADFMLPPILPILYYDGEGQWTAPKNLKDKIIKVEGIETFYPQMEFKLIRLNTIAESTLRKLNNVLGAYLLLNHPKVQKKYREKIFRLLIKLHKKMPKEDQKLLQQYVRSIVQSLAKEISPEDQRQLESTEGVVETMTVMEEIYHENYLKGIELGKEQGKSEGIEIGKSEGIEIGKSEGIEIGKSEGILEAAIAILEAGTTMATLEGLSDSLKIPIQTILDYQKKKQEQTKNK